MHSMIKARATFMLGAFVYLFNYFMSLGKCNSLFKRDVAENTECFARQKWSSCHIYVIQNDGLIRFHSFLSRCDFACSYIFMYGSHPIVGFSQTVSKTWQPEFPIQHYSPLSLVVWFCFVLFECSDNFVSFSFFFKPFHWCCWLLSKLNQA